MSYLLGASPILAATITLPRVGAWRIDARLDTRTVPSGRVTFTGGGLTLVGTVVRAGAWRGGVEVHVIGGAGGLGTTLAAQAYRSATVRVVATDALTGGGETLSSTSDAEVLATGLDAWVRAEASVGGVLAALAEENGASWRVLADGTVWVGVESWPVVAPAHELVRREPSRGRDVVWTERLSLAPGTTFLGRRVEEVEHSIEAQHVRTTVTYADAVGLRAALAAIIRHEQAIDTFALYPARVAQQHADGTLELAPDDERLPDASKVPIRLGIPGASVKVAAGARVLLGFEAGDRRRPYASLWESGSVTELKLDATTIVLNGGTAKVARANDPCTHSLSVVVPPGAAGGTFPIVGTIQINPSTGASGVKA